MDPIWAIWKYFWLEIVIVSHLGDQVEFWSEIRKRISLGQTDRYGVGNVCIGDLLGLVDCRMLRYVKTKVFSS